MTESIHLDLQQADLLPAEHLLDTGYVTSRTLVTSQERFGVKMIGPVLAHLQWQACTDQGIDASQFVIDWEGQQATCPQGRTSRSWTSVADPKGHPLIRVHFSRTDCGHCPMQSRCIHSTEKYKRRVLTLHPQAQHEALQAARKFQQTTAFTQQYHLREGIEATLSESAFALSACVVLATLERQKRICSMWALLPLSMSAA